LQKQLFSLQTQWFDLMSFRIWFSRNGGVAKRGFAVISYQ